MGIVSEMKKKIAERGGTIPEGQGVADAFKSYDAAIGEGSGGSALPSVTSADNGDVLTVVDGAWAKAAPSGGSDLPAVTEDDNGDVLTVVDGAWSKASPSGGGTSLVELKLAYYESQLEEGAYVFEIIGNDEGDSVTGETIMQYFKNGQIPYIMFPISDGNGHPDDTIKMPNIFSGISQEGDGGGGTQYNFLFGQVVFSCSSLNDPDHPLSAWYEF